MSRYIDADKLIDDIRPFAEYDSNRSNKDWVRRFEIAIETQQTANVVEVVRCKDCRHYKRNVPCVGGYYNGCDEWLDEGNPITVYDNDFCSYGERAEK